MIRRLARLIGRVAGIGTGAYLAYVAVRGSGLLVRPEVRAFLPDPAGGPATPADLGLEYEPVRFRSDDGVTLSGWLVPAARPTRTAVVLLHGFAGHRLPELVTIVPWLRREHHVLQFDFRGHGESDAGVVTLGTFERRDVAAAVRFVEGRGLGPTALMGISMGAAIAIVAAPGVRVSAVVADAAFADLHHPIANRLRQSRYPLAGLGARGILAGARLRARSALVSPIRAVGAIAPRALLLIAPREDRLISWRQSLRLYAAAGEPKDLYIVHGAGHAEAYAVDPAEYERRVLEFLRRHLG